MLLTLTLAALAQSGPEPLTRPAEAPAAAPEPTRLERPEGAPEGTAEPAEAPTPIERPPTPSLAEPSAPTSDLDALRAELAQTQATLAAQQAELERLNQQLVQTRLSLIPKEKLTFEMQGHYRARAMLFNHLFASQMQGKNYLGDARYMEQRLRLRPVFDYDGLASLNTEFDLLDGTVWGDNQSLATTALFAGDPSSTTLDGDEVTPIRLRRAWLTVTLPLGRLQIGRQSNTWGMGLLANEGDGFDTTFGEKRYGTINDRFLFATRPVAIAQRIAGKEDSGLPLYTVIAVDRLVEDPLHQYYGYTCEPGLVRADAGFDPRCDSDGDGLTDLDHSWDDDTRLPEQRSQDWWVDQTDDVKQMIYVLVYRGEDVKYLGGTGDLTAGAWVVHRTQAETESNVLIVDGYLKAAVHGALVEFEGISIRGDTRAITLPSSEGRDPLAKQAAIAGYVGRLGYTLDPLTVRVETGYASGDDNVSDDRFTGRPLHPDHNVGLLLYEEVLARVTQQIWTTSAEGLWSRGGVYNSRYLFPNVSVVPLENWEILAAFLMAWPDRPDGAVIRCREGDKVDCTTPSSQQATSGPIGSEFDFAIKHRWHEHVLFSLETGFARATDRLPLEIAGLNPEGKFFTVQSRLAWEF